MSKQTISAYLEYNSITKFNYLTYEVLDIPVQQYQAQAVRDGGGDGDHIVAR